MTTNPPVPDDASVPDEALDRVRAADPAATAEPDQTRLRAASRTESSWARVPRVDWPMLLATGALLVLLARRR